MQGEPTGAEPRAAPKRTRGKWLWAAVLIGVVAAGLLWPRKTIRIPLSDGSTFEIAEITTGLDHRHTPRPIWRGLLGPLSRGVLRWPVETIRFEEPRIVFWCDEATRLGVNEMILVDRHGWRWAASGMRLGPGFVMSGPPVECDGPLHVELLDGKRQRVGEAEIPLPGDPRPPKRPTEPDPFPIRRTEGPLSVVVRSLQASVQEGTPSRARGQLEIEVLWNDRPIPAVFGRLTLMDSLGRKDTVDRAPGGRFETSLSPHDTTWEASLEVFRGPEVPLEPDEIVATDFPPSGETPLKTREGTIQEKRWRATFVPPGSTSVQLVNQPEFINAHTSLRIDAGVPVIMVEVESKRGLEVRIEPLGADGTPLPVQRVPLKYRPPNAWAIGCPAFDPAKGHRLRIGFNFARTIRFAARPEVVGADSRP